MATDKEMQELLDAMVLHAMTQNADAIRETYWLGGGAARVTYEDGEIVVTPISLSEMWIKPMASETKDAE